MVSKDNQHQLLRALTVPDIDWEYPGGNGADYREVPNSAKQGEIAAFPRFLDIIRKAIGTEKILSIAVPGLERDMLAFTPETGPLIWPSVDFVNVSSSNQNADFLGAGHVCLHIDRS